MFFLSRRWRNRCEPCDDDADSFYSAIPYWQLAFSRCGGKDRHGVWPYTVQIKLADEMQPIFCTLRAKVRSIYKRTAFQRDDSNSVRISLDTALQLFKEESYPSGAMCAGDEDLPDPSRSYYFPYAILEVKLSGAEEPAWVKNILATCDVTEVRKKL